MNTKKIKRRNTGTVKCMEASVKMLIVCSGVLAFGIISMMVRGFSVYLIVLSIIDGLLAVKYAKEVVDDHTVNNVVIGFVDDGDGNEHLEKTKEWHGYDFKHNDTETHSESDIKNDD